MKALPPVTSRDEFDALVVRTDYHDDSAWQEVAVALTEFWGDDARICCVDNPAWADATIDEVLTAVCADEDLAVVFLADRTTMRTESRPLLAVTAVTREECVNDEEYQELTAFGREFRTAPAGVHDIHANLSIGNLGFEEYAEWAHGDPDGIYRPF